MDKTIELKKYIDISGFNINQANRGNAALSYGALSFLKQKGLFKEGQELVRFFTYANFFKLKNIRPRKESFLIEGKDVVLNHVPMFILERYLIRKWGVVLPFTYFGRYVRKTAFEAADYGGDGFSDIYGDQLFISRMGQTFLLRKANVPLIMLPMTIGPFQKEYNYQIAKDIMQYATKVYVRDNKFTSELDKIGIKYEQEKDLSAYMLPEKWDIKIEQPAIGINVSGLAYSNAFPNLEGQFDSYPALIDSLISYFREKGYHIYLIPHSYNYNNPEENNDDMVACRMAYDRLEDKDHVTFVDADLISPRVKYVISQMKFFIGTRMHANFAAIYTNTPVFGLAYSYKFEGAFKANGLNPQKQTYMINNLPSDKIGDVIKKIDDCFAELTKN
jgi:hypothetical protein